ncbi:MAG: hypothetical protein VYE68_15105 [Acidobacteriota bacterium]|nr:hypothetical protein [Acidobacteriota bacterium]
MKPGCLVLLASLVAITACDTALRLETPGLAQEATFTPREVTDADIPTDIHDDSWARLPTITRESLAPEGQRVFDIIVNPDSRYATGLRGPIGMWMYSPAMAEHLFPASTYLRFGADGRRDQRLAELAILTAARSLHSQYEWSAHEPLAQRANLEDDIIDLLRFDRPLTASELPGLGERERTIIRATRELIRDPKLSADTFQDAQRLFGNQGVVDLIGLVGHYTTVNYTLKAFDVQRPPGSQLLLPLP